LSLSFNSIGHSPFIIEAMVVSTTFFLQSSLSH